MTESTPRRIPRWIKFSLMMLTTFLISLSILRSPIISQEFPDLHSQEGNSEKRRDFPDLELIDMQGVSRQLSSFSGKVVLVSFWASWCGPCLEELPVFASLQKKYYGDLEVVAVNQDEDASIRQFMDKFWPEHQIPFPSYFDPTHKLAKAVELEVLPTNFLIDRQGKLVFASHGYNDWMSPNSQTFIEDLIAEKK